MRYKSVISIMWYTKKIQANASYSYGYYIIIIIIIQSSMLDVIMSYFYLSIDAYKLNRSKA